MSVYRCDGRVGSLEQTVASYGLVPEFLHRPVARSLPILEVLSEPPACSGLCPRWPALSRSCCCSDSLLEWGWNLARGRRFDCGCGMDYYLDEFTFRFNRRRARHRGLLFHRLLEGAVASDPRPYKELISKPAA